MKRTFSLTALACAMTVGLAAQAPSPSAGGAQSGSSSDAKKVTVTGCIEKASASTAASPTGTTGSTGAMAGADTTKFVLKNVTADASSTGATAGAAGTSGSMSTASSYRLDGEDAKLTHHVGHKVEITGTDDTMSSTAGESSTAGAASSSASSSGPKLKVDSVKMVSATCTPQ